MRARKRRAAYMTLAEFEELPDDGCRYELIDGRLVETPAPSEVHQDVVYNIYWLLREFIRDRRLGGKVLGAPFECVLAGDPEVPKAAGPRARAVQPDVLYVSEARRGLLDGKRLNGAPDLVVEVFHHGSALYDTEEKRTLYALHGVREYWQIDLDRKAIVVLTLTDAGYEETSRAAQGGRATSRLLEGFIAGWSEVFRQD